MQKLVYFLIETVAVIVAVLALDHITPGDNLVHACVIVFAILTASKLELGHIR